MMFRYKKFAYCDYADPFVKWEVRTDLAEEEVLDRCFKEFNNGKKLPGCEEWQENTKTNNDFRSYSHGYYSLKKTDNQFGYDIYLFKIFKPMIMMGA